MKLEHAKRTFFGAVAIVLAASTHVALADEAEQVKQILTTSKIRGGLAVVLGCGDGKLTAALAADGRFLVHGFDADAGTIDRTRKLLRDKSLTRTATVRQWTANRLPYAENMVNLLVVQQSGGIPREERLRVLVPGGAVCHREGGAWSPTTKPRPAAMDDWTHWLYDACGNAVSNDTIAGPPRQLQWIAGPHWSRHHHTVPSVTAQVTSGGRIFSVVDEAPAGMDGSVPDKWALVARDAFNGLPLWRVPMPEWGWKTWSAGWTCRFTIPTHIARRLVAVGDRVYTTLGFNAPLTELDATTGRVLRTFKGTENTDEIMVHAGQLILSLNKAPQRPSPADNQRRGMEDDPPVRKSVAVIDIATGKMLWKTGDYVGLQSKTGSMDRINHLSMCAGDGRAFLVDGDKIVALNVADGKTAWTLPRPASPEHKMRYNIRLSDMCSLVYNDGMVYFGQIDPAKRVGWREVRGKLHAISAATGKELWSRECASWGWAHPIDVFCLQGLVWVHGFGNDTIHGLDPATGVERKKVSNFAAFDNGHHHRCYRNKATTRFMMTSYRGLEFIDWKGGVTDLNHWVRGTCRMGAMPANGLIYATPHPCDCYVSSKLNGFVALAPAPPTPPATAGPRLVRGPAFSPATQQSMVRNPESADWPTYRHDPQRSGSTTAAPPADFKEAWRFDIGATPTACVTVGDTVYVAGVESGDVVALDAETGKLRWRFTAAGRIDTPPTVDGRQVLVGSANGWVYALRATDGALAWRFRAAPAERLVGSFDGVESAWPVVGCVLVRDGKASLTAGRSSFLDGGIYAYQLDARTGKLLTEKRIATPHDMKVDKGRTILDDTGRLADLLVGHADGIYMRNFKIFTTGGKAGAVGPLWSSAGLLDAGWSSRARWYMGDVQTAEYLVFDANRLFGIRAREGVTGYAGFFTPGDKGYELFAADLPLVLAGKGKRLAKRWSVRIPVRASSMVLAGEKILAAGTPDSMDPKDPWAAYEGKRGGVLMVISAANGKVLSQRKLDGAPILDGMALARGKLLISLADGRIVCFH